MNETGHRSARQKRKRRSKRRILNFQAEGLTLRGESCAQPHFGDLDGPHKSASQPADRCQNCFGPCAHSYVIGQVHPSDRAHGVYYKLSRTSNVLTVFAGLRMQHAVLPDHLRGWIGEEREAISPGLAEFLRLGGRIHADRDNLDAPVMELAQVLFETPQLGVAERSPIAAVEDQHNCAMAFQQFRGSHGLSGDVLKNKWRRGLAWAQRTLC